jgi:hypothetical protein
MRGDLVKHNLSGMRVLIVEDEYFLADDLARAIKKAGGQVVGPAAEQGEAQVRRWEKPFRIAALVEQLA